jgi:hypothetical protein
MAPRIINVEQGTRQWFLERLGIPTASMFKSIMAKGRTKGSYGAARRTYMLQLLAERISGQVTHHWASEHTARGHEDEPKARCSYSFESGNKVEQVGFVMDDELGAGFSPDGLVGADGIVEIKSKLGHLHLGVMLDDCVPKEHIHQCQGGLLVTGREWCDFVSYSDGLPLFTKRMHRDEDIISEMRQAIADFNGELALLESKVREMDDRWTTEEME